MKEFQAVNKLKQAAITYIATQLSTKDEELRLQQTFKEIDENQDGLISKKELYNAYKKIYPMQSEDELNKLVDNVFE
jgi:calcium-dependent protein kinase